MQLSGVFKKKKTTSLTNTSGRYIIWIEGPTILANTISLVTVSFTECMFATSHLVARCFEIYV